MDTQRKNKEYTNNCICEGNFRDLIYQYSPYFGKMYINKYSNTFILVGILFAEDDFYYSLYSPTDQRTYLYSCVGDLESYDFELLIKGEEN